MTRRLAELTLWLLTGAAVLAAGIRFPGHEPPAGGQVFELLSPPAVPRQASERALGEALESFAASNPFRLDRGLAGVPVSDDGSTTERGDALDEHSWQRPTFALAGVIGPPWEAVIEGFPGKEHGVIVRQGDNIDGYAILRVGAHGVVIEGADGTWHLEVKRPWE